MKEYRAKTYETNPKFYTDENHVQHKPFGFSKITNTYFNDKDKKIVWAGISKVTNGLRKWIYVFRRNEKGQEELIYQS